MNWNIHVNGGFKYWLPLGRLTATCDCLHVWIYYSGILHSCVDWVSFLTHIRRLTHNVDLCTRKQNIRRYTANSINRTSKFFFKKHTHLIAREQKWGNHNWSLDCRPIVNDLVTARSRFQFRKLDFGLDGLLVGRTSHFSFFLLSFIVTYFAQKVNFSTMITPNSDTLCVNVHSQIFGIKWNTAKATVIQCSKRKKCPR